MQRSVPVKGFVITRTDGGDVSYLTEKLYWVKRGTDEAHSPYVHSPEDMDYIYSMIHSGRWDVFALPEELHAAQWSADKGTKLSGRSQLFDIRRLTPQRLAP